MTMYKLHEKRITFTKKKNSPTNTREYCEFSRNFVPKSSTINGNANIQKEKGMQKKNKHLFYIDLQLFAEGGEKTEKATSKKREDSRKKGQVRQSKELTAGILLLTMFVILKSFGPYMLSELEGFMKSFYLKNTNYEDLFNINELTLLFLDVIIVFLKVTAPIFITAIIVAVTVQYAQVGNLFTVEAIQFKLEKLNPLNGFKRMFSIRSLAELVKSLLKIFLIGLTGYLYVKNEVVTINKLMDLSILQSSAYIFNMSMDLAIRMCVVVLVLGILDFLYQTWQYEKDLRMTKQEVKEEHKQQEGNPQIKSKIRSKMREASLRRMMQEIPKADVVITNPTHFAAVIKYDPSKSDAPMLVAKGQDYIALRIREIAKEHKVEIVENKPLARALYSNVEIGQSIPPDLYQAVAEVLAYVYSLKNQVQ